MCYTYVYRKDCSFFYFFEDFCFLFLDLANMFKLAVPLLRRTLPRKVAPFKKFLPRHFFSHAKVPLTPLLSAIPKQKLAAFGLLGIGSSFTFASYQYNHISLCEAAEINNTSPKPIESIATIDPIKEETPLTESDNSDQKTDSGDVILPTTKQLPALISTSGGIWMWVLRAAAADWYLYLAAAGASIGMALCGVQTSFLFGEIFETFKGSEVITKAFEEGKFWKPVRKLLMLFTIQFGLNFGAASFLARATNNLGQRLRRSYFASVLRQDTTFFDTHKTGELMQQLGEDIGAIQTAVRQCLTTGLRSVFDIALGGMAMWSVSRELTLALFGVLPAMALSGHILGGALRKTSREVSKKTGAASSVASEDISNIKTVKAFTSENNELIRYDTALSKATVLKTNMSIATGAFFGMIHLGINLVQLGIAVYGGTLIRDGNMSSGGMISVVSQTMRLQRAFAGLSRTSSNLVKAISTCDNVYSIAKRQNGTNSTTSTNLVCPLNVEGHLHFLNVTFSYPTRPDIKVLNSLYLEIQPGTVVALVGPSGSGKSTVGCLLEKFYKPNDGTITLDGRALNEIDTTWLRENIGMVDQTPALFAASVMENVRYGTPSATDEEVYAACHAANCHEFITEFPNGYDEELGERGSQISGGQRQRLAIARALLRNPKILLLDEATSALDSESERCVQSALDALMKDRTTLVIAHRLSTIVNADLICVLDSGKVIEQGTHEELLRQNGKYAQLYKSQEKDEKKKK